MTPDCLSSAWRVNGSPTTARALYREGVVVLHEAVDWTEGAELEVRPADSPSISLHISGPKPASELLAYLDQLSVEEPACFLSETALDRLAQLQETPFESASHWRDENPASGE